MFWAHLIYGHTPSTILQCAWALSALLAVILHATPSGFKVLSYNILMYIGPCIIVIVEE